MGDNKDSAGLVLLGILVGIIAITLLSRRTQTLSLQHIQQPTNQYLDWQPIDIPRVDNIRLQTVPQQVQSVQIVKTDHQLVQMASQLEKTAYQLEQATSKLQDTISRLQQNSPPSQLQPIIIQPVQTYQPQPIIIQPTPIHQQHQPTHTNTQLVREHLQQDQPQQDNSQQISNTVYKNNEQWEIKRGADGRIKSLNIVRNVKKNN